MNLFSDWSSDIIFKSPTRTQRNIHTYVIGQPGTGKSRALESWIRQDINLGHGVGVIDPHGDLFNNLIYYLANKPDLWNRVIILDPCHPKWINSFNPLESFRGISQERLALFLSDIVIKIWGINPANAPRMVWLLQNCFLALTTLKLTLLDLPRFLLDSSYRENLLQKVNQESVRSYFKFEFPKSQGAIHQWVTPVLNKIGSLIFDPDVSLMLAGKPKFNFREILDQKSILLVNIPKGVLGEGASALLGAFIVAQIQKAALSRADSIQRESFFLYLDEFQNYTTDNIQDVLSESRKYGLSLILANQYLDQISYNLRSAVLNTTGAFACFRIGYQDAYHLAKEIFPSPDFINTAEDQVIIKHFGGLPYLDFKESKQDGASWETLAKVLTQIPTRSFWYRSRLKSAPVLHHAFRVPDPIRTMEMTRRVDDLYAISCSRYGRLKKEAKKELSNNDLGYRGIVENHDNGDSGGECQDSPFWGF